jgi:DNA primase
MPGTNIVSEILEILSQNPQLSTASLLERWRDRDEEQHLSRLMEWSPPHSDEETLTTLFDDALEQLRRKHAEMGLEHLLRKAEQESLSDEEKDRLRILLSNQRAPR